MIAVILIPDFRFDSPPLDHQFDKNAQIDSYLDVNVIKDILPSLNSLTPDEIMVKLNAYKSTNRAMVSKLDKKLYIGTRYIPSDTPYTILILV